MSADKEVTTPRLLYRGPASDAAETIEAKDAADLADKLKAGWRLKRIDKTHEAEPAPVASIAVPAQTLQVDPKDVKKDGKK